MNIGFVSFVWFLTLFIAGTTKVSEQETKTYQVVEHETLIVNCNATDNNSIDIYWTKDETGSDFYQAGSALNLTNITRYSSGLYVCHSFNTSSLGDDDVGNNVTVEVVNVDVLYPAEITDFEVTPDTINENETFTIRCVMVGNPAPTWEVRNNYTKHVFDAVRNYTANVTLPDARVDCGDMGLIECTGFNGLNNGHNASRGTNLTVMCAPKPNPSVTIQNESYAFIGESAIFFILNVVGYPYPSYAWSREDGRPMPAHTQIDYPFVAVLNISNVRIEDFGNYVLTMNNSLGSSSVEFELHAFGRPEAPHNLTYTNLTYNSVTLHWVSGFDMNAKQHFVIVQKIGGSFIQTSNTIRGDYDNHGVGQNWTHTDHNLKSSMDYTLSVVAINKWGSSTMGTPPVSFTAKADPNPSPDPSSSVALSSYVIGAIVTGSLTAFGGLFALLALLYTRQTRRRRAVYKTMT